MNCEHLRPDLGAYVLGGLDPDEAAAVRRHLETCEDCAAELDSLAPLPGLLSLAGGAEEAAQKPLSPAFEERLLDAYARDRTISPRRRLTWQAEDETTPWLRMWAVIRRADVVRRLDLGRRRHSGSLVLRVPRGTWQTVLWVSDSTGNRTRVPVGPVPAPARR